MQQRDEFLFVEKYRPRKIDDTILPYELKTVFKEFIANNNIPNLILSGGPGVGKTTVARAMLEEISADYIIIKYYLFQSLSEEFCLWIMPCQNMAG